MMLGLLAAKSISSRRTPDAAQWRLRAAVTAIEVVVTETADVAVRAQQVWATRRAGQSQRQRFLSMPSLMKANFTDAAVRLVESNDSVARDEKNAV